MNKEEQKLAKEIEELEQDKRNQEIRNEQIKRLEEEKDLVGEAKKGKRDKSSWWKSFFNKNKLKKPDNVAIIYLRNNGNAELLDQKPKDGFFTINGRTYHERYDCIYTVTKDRIPLAIIREWDIFPLGTKRWEEEDMREKFAQLEEHVLKGIRHAELVKMGGGGFENKITTKQMIVWGILAVVAGAILINYI